MPTAFATSRRVGASRLAQRGGIDRGGHGLHGGGDLLGKEAQALFGVVSQFLFEAM
jgi:hypothetical protein